VSAVYAFINSEEGNYPVVRMCIWSKVSKSGYYAWKKATPSLTARRRGVLATLVRRSFQESDGTYGYRRVHADLADWGYPCHPDTVRSIMAELDLVSCQPRPFRPVTTLAGPDEAPVADLLERDFTAAEPGTKLVGDITYVRTWAGWVYLATVLDCATKMVIGYAMAEHMRTSLVTDALGMAVRNGRTRPKAIFHSDRGCQYTSDDFAVFARDHDIRRSMGRTGVCWDNAWAESWNGSLKNELVNRTTYPTRERAIADITRWIELRYNRLRRHSALGYRTPIQAENDWHATNKAA
jgi:putative transposase